MIVKVEMPPSPPAVVNVAPSPVFVTVEPPAPGEKPAKPAADDVSGAGKPKQPPSRKGRAWPILLALMRKHPEPAGPTRSYAGYLADKQDPADGKPISAKTFANLMPEAKREIARERARNRFPRETFPKIVSRGETPGKSGKA